MDLLDNDGMQPLESTTVQQVLIRPIVTVSMDASLETIRDMFGKHKFHHLLVVEGRKLVGVISDRDLWHNLSPFVGNQMSERSQDVATLHKRAHQIMSRDPITARPETTLGDAVNLILTNKISCLPIVDGNHHPVGIVTWRDILRAIVPEKTN